MGPKLWLNFAETHPRRKNADYVRVMKNYFLLAACIEGVCDDFFSPTKKCSRISCKGFFAFEMIVFNMQMLSTISCNRAKASSAALPRKT
jgi:hypothetical protein